jgi:hypothetical protein
MSFTLPGRSRSNSTSSSSSSSSSSYCDGGGGGGGGGDAPRAHRDDTALSQSLNLDSQHITLAGLAATAPAHLAVQVPARPATPTIDEWIASDDHVGAKTQELGKSDGPDSKLNPCSSFGLKRWKEFAVLKHSGTREFRQSTHGQAILRETALKREQETTRELRLRVKDLELDIGTLGKALDSERDEKRKLRLRNVTLEEALAKLEDGRRRAAASSCKGRISNLERRLVTGPGATTLNLRGYLHGSQSVKSQGSTSPRSATQASSSPLSPSGGAFPSNAAEHSDLERGEVARRRAAEMGAMQAKIDKLQLEVKRLQGERDGLALAVKSHAEMWAEHCRQLEQRADDRIPAPPPRLALS